MTPLDTIRHYCKDNNLGPRKLAKAAGITKRRAQYFLDGNTPNYEAVIAIQRWYDYIANIKKT